LFSTCLFCHTDLGHNDSVERCGVGRRLAFDAKKGRLWVVCTQCGRWNLTPLEDRWEPIERCEQLFRDTWQRFTVDNIGVARTKERLELVRIGDALPSEIASWRYGARLERWAGSAAPIRGVVRRSGRFIARRLAAALARGATVAGLSDNAILRVSTLQRRNAVLARSTDESDRCVTIRYAHLAHAELIRPARDMPWRVRVMHDEGRSVLAEGAGLYTAGKLLAVLNFAAASHAEVQWAVSKLGDAGDPTGFFTRIASLALRTEWGLRPEAPDTGPAESQATTVAERLALRLANRSFWGHGGIGSSPTMPLYRLPSVNRLALEMAANEDAERRALEGELDDLREAWREAEEIAEIADNMFVGETLEEFKRQYYVRLQTEGHA
jgi:hypothetical protein